MIRLRSLRLMRGPSTKINPYAFSFAIHSKLSLSKETFSSLTLSSTSPSPSTVRIGTQYEELSREALRSLGFDLRRIGGRDDRGTDLIGHWRPPCPSYETVDKLDRDSSATSLSMIEDATNTAVSSTLHKHSTSSLSSGIPVLVQCKAHTGQPQPSWIRELEGAFTAAQDAWQTPGAVGVLVATGSATSGVRTGVMASSRGLMWIQLVQSKDGASSRIAQVLWNRKVSDMLAPGVGSSIRHKISPHGKLEAHIRLAIDGQLWEPSI